MTNKPLIIIGPEHQYSDRRACGIKSALCIPLDIPGNSVPVYICTERTYSGGLVAILIKPTEMDRNIRVLIDTAAWYRYFVPFLYFLKEKAIPDIYGCEN